jgi:1-phosphofructokinase family hexose kinase
MADVLAIATAVALDRYGTIERLTLGTINRPGEIREFAGGKGLNVARTVQQLGGTAHAVGIIGGTSGHRVRQLLDDNRVAATWVTGDAPTRQCLALFDSHTGAVTELYEPAQTATETEWAEFAAACEDQAGRHRGVATISGRVPPGIGEESLAELVALVKRAGCQVLLDCQGPGSAAAVRAGADWVKLNQDEATELLGEWGVQAGDAAGLATELAARTDARVVITLGGRGAVACADGETLVVTHPPLERPHPTGSGDAFLAACALATARGQGPADALMFGAAAARANAARHDAGCISLTDTIEQKALLNLTKA